MKKNIINLLITALILAVSLSPIIKNGVPETKRGQVVFPVSAFLKSLESLGQAVLPIKNNNEVEAEEDSPGICGIRG